MDIRTISNLSRFKDIVITLLNYGFKDLVDRLDLPGFGYKGGKRKVDHSLETYERIRCALEDLGPTFIKFGQIMSMRPDLIPKPLINELRKLQDEASKEDFADIRNAAEKTMKRPIEDVFSFFEEQPLAAASLSQVHRAILRENGLDVAVKVQRPGIRTKVNRDLDIIKAVAERLHERITELRIYDLPSIVQIIRKMLLKELNFLNEARYMRIAQSYLDKMPRVRVPDVYQKYCTEQLVVMELVKGVKLKDLEEKDIAESRTLARQGLRWVIKQILEDGFFHADPHPGNVMITEGGVLWLLDWGMVGRLNLDSRHELIDFLGAVVEKDSRLLVRSLSIIATAEGEVENRGLERDLMDILDFYFGIPIKDLNLGNLLLDITHLLREYKLHLPPDLSIMIKALITGEGTARQLYPELNVIKEAEGYVKRLSLQRLGPRKLIRDLRSLLSELLSLFRRSPRQIPRIIEKMEKGELSIRFEHENLGGLINTLENTFNRLTFAIIIAAMVIGSSMIITTGIKPLIFGFPAFGIIGYLISGVLGLLVIFNIIRRKY